ncbi:MAG: alkaline phosphatase family protein [Sedimentisphaerales bacterium]|nr:alkaline phosphatase family protein [Sedimentisphaerales bacterium]
MATSRLVIFGLDGVPYEMLAELAERGVMPHTRKLIQAGFFSSMQSSVPEISSVAWSSLITGENPGRHGVFGFLDLQPDSMDLFFPQYTTLKATPFWESAAVPSVIINVPSTYPVRAMNGVHISGFVSVDLEKSVYPASLLAEVKELDYRLDVESEKAHTDMEAFIKDLDDTLTARVKLAERLWRREPWGIFMLVFTGTDRLLHFLYSAYADESHPRHAYFLDYFRRIDEAIGRFIGLCSSDDTILMLSDHGFERMEENVFVNYFLQQSGFLILRPNAQRLAAIDPRSRAFALDPGRIYLCHPGRMAQGAVKNIEACLQELVPLLEGWEIDGRKVLEHVYRREDIYDGPFVNHAAELILVANPGFNLKGALRADSMCKQDIFSGKHSPHNAFILAGKAFLRQHLQTSVSIVDTGRLLRQLASSL